MKISTLKLFAFLFAFFALAMISTSLYAQEDEDNPTKWKYFKINASTDDDSVYIKIQDEVGIDPKLSTYVLIVNVLDRDPANQFLQFGDEGNTDAPRFSWSQISKPNQEKLLNWSGSNKENLNKKKLNYGDVFLYAIKKIKIKELFAPPKKIREITSSTAYINPFFNFMGADPLGMPIKKGFGFSFYTGSPYSGPLETDMYGANFHLLGASVGIVSRVKEWVLKHEAGSTGNEKQSTFGNYNNVYGPKLGLKGSYVVPFGNFFEVSYLGVIDTGDWDPPISIKDNLNGGLMPNNVLHGSYFNFEFRYPFRTFGSSRAKIYVAKYLGELQIGYIGRELRLAGSTFDVRINFMPNNQNRNMQILFETYISSIGEGFAMAGFAMGPSIRLTTGPNGGITVVTALLNARLKVGDFFDEK